MPTFDADTLTQFATRLFAAGGISPAEAALVARSLVGANLRGHDSHGVMRIPFYLDRSAKGEIVPGAPTANHARNAVAAGGRRPLGLRPDRRPGADGAADRQGPRARACASARSFIAQPHRPAGRVLRTGGRGRHGLDGDGQHARQLAARGAAGRQGAAAGHQSAGHRRAARRRRRCCWTLAPAPRPRARSASRRSPARSAPTAGCWTTQGQPTNDPATLYGDPPGTIRPMGGDQAYKGFGLGLMVEIFAGALSGGVTHPREADQPERQLRLHAGRRSGRNWAARSTLPPKWPA